jgi:hypothetical protein
MKRRRIKPKTSLEERLANQAKRLRKQAKTMPPGAERNDLIRRASQNEAAANLNAWLTSPGLASPK